MIETIIKRNGQREPFIAEKPNRWAQWAAELVGDRIDWPSVLLKAIYKSPKEITSRDFQNNLIESTLEGRSWSHYLMAGRLYTSMIYKDIFGSDVPPSVKSVQRALADAGLMRTLKYSDEEYAELEKVINHNRDLECPHFALHHIRYKYSLRNRVTKKEYESQQFVYMRMAMALAEAETDKEVRMVKVKDLYDLFSRKILSAPTPNYVNLGTYLNSYASCCLFTSSDSAGSLAAGDHIAYMQTVASAGIGGNIRTRSIGDPVRGGLIQHQGRLPYLNSVGKATRANLQNGRGGAGNIFFSAFDPEALVISKLSNPRSTEDKKNRDLHYTMMGNAWLAYKAARNEDIFVFNCFNAPDLDRAFYSGDIDNFIDLYEKYENDPGFKKTYVSAKKLIVSSFNEAFETGVSYQANMDEINRHTPYLETIWSSNLCVEITQPTIDYPSVKYLYMEEDHGQGEVSTCNLAAIEVSNVKDDAEYEKAMYYAYYMIDRTTDMADYILPHVGYTAKRRRNAAVGIMGLATLMARSGVKYSDQTGLRFAHRVAERHMYFAIKASLRHSKERGLAPWIHKTKWPQGWLPIDTYNRGVDELGKFEYRYDWETLRKQIIENGGIGHSSLVAYMPGEASSKALGGANSLYPIRALTINKSDNNIVIRWAAPEGDTMGHDYEIAWDIPTKRLIDIYSIFQKFTDQSISADLYKKISKDNKIDEEEIMDIYLHGIRRGLKTRYYVNSYTADGDELDAVQRGSSDMSASDLANAGEERGCAGGACSL